MERIAITVGLFELIFIPAMFFAEPDFGEVAASIVGPQPLDNASRTVVFSLCKRWSRDYAVDGIYPARCSG